MFKCENCIVTCGEVERTDVENVCRDCRYQKGIVHSKMRVVSKNIQTFTELSDSEGRNE
jgi:hypothetical protein